MKIKEVFLRLSFLLTVVYEKQEGFGRWWCVNPFWADNCETNCALGMLDIVCNALTSPIERSFTTYVFCHHSKILKFIVMEFGLLLTTFIFAWSSRSFLLASTWICELTCFRVLVFPVRILIYRAISSFRPNLIEKWKRKMF